MQTDLNYIAQKSIADAVENDRFIDFLGNINSALIDDLVFELDQKITPQIDCLQCGNCCKTLMINVEEKEADEVARALHLTRQNFDAKFIEKSYTGKLLINTIPCHFLGSDNKCAIYLNRFSGCKEFPALHLPQIKKRLFTIFMHYGRCPIIFNVVEQLKQVLGFNV